MTVKLSSLKRKLSEEILPTNFVGGVFPRKHVSILSSAPGVGKTWFLLKLMLDLSIGGNIFLSLSDHEPSRKTLFLCGEAGLEMMIERTKLLRQAYDESKIAIYTASDFAQNNVDITLDNKEGMQNFRNLVKGEHPDLVIIDTLISFRSDDENASKETSRLFRKLIGVADQNNCAIIVSHHVRKRKTAERDLPATQDEIIGSSAITRLSGTAFMLSKGEKDAFTKLQCVKSWWEKPDTLYWRIVNTKNGVQIEQAELSDATSGRLKCERYIDKMANREGIDIPGLRRACACSEDVAQGAIANAVKKGVLEKRSIAGKFVFFARKQEDIFTEEVSDSQ